MDTKELLILKNKIKILNILNFLFWIINILLIVIPFYHYWNIGFKFDMYFWIITILNVLGFYLSYLITDKLVFFKLKHRHFTEKLNNKL